MQKIEDSDFTVPRCTSHCFAFLKNVSEHASGHQRNKMSQFREYTTSTQLRTSYKDRKPIGLVKKDLIRKKLSKNTSDRCCRTNKAGIQNQLFAEEEFWPQNYNFSSKKRFLQTGKSCFSQKTRTSRFGTKQVEKVYRRTPPYLTYIGDSIDQGATRLGGL